MSDNINNAEMMEILNQLREQITTLTAEVNELKTGHCTENEDDEDNDDASMKSQAPPKDPLQQKLERYVKMFESSHV